MKVYFCFVFSLFGLVFGSFCNCWAWRIVHGESVLRGRSHCALCNHELAAKDLVPLFSWLFLKGRCRYCQEKISPRYPLAELICALLFLSLFLRYGLSLECLRFIILFCILLVASLVDFDIMELPDGLMLAAAAASLLRLVSDPSSWKDILLGAFAISLPLLLISLIMDRILQKDTLGGGDIKLIAALGMNFGPVQTLFLIIVACLLGIVFAYCAKKEKGMEFPFGPVISASAWITALFGSGFISWYLGLF